MSDKVKTTNYFSRVIDERIRHRTVLSKRGYSAEIEYCLEKYFKICDANDAQAIAMAGSENSKQTQQQASSEDDCQRGPLGALLPRP